MLNVVLLRCKCHRSVDATFLSLPGFVSLQCLLNLLSWITFQSLNAVHNRYYFPRLKQTYLTWHHEGFNINFFFAHWFFHPFSKSHAQIVGDVWSLRTLLGVHYWAIYSILSLILPIFIIFFFFSHLTSYGSLRKHNLGSLFIKE